MLSAQKAPPPGARAVTGLRAQAQSARRTALIALSGSIALITAAQLLAERARTREGTLPLAVLALGLFLGALPVLAVTQGIWGARARAVRRRELELYSAARGAWPRLASRLGVAACWAVTLLLGFTVPRLFRESGMYGLAGALTSAADVVAIPAYAAGAFFLLWWGRDAAMTLARVRSGGAPGDPWDPGSGRRGRGVAALWAGAVLAVTALVAARAHLWEPPTALVYALLAAALVLALVTRE
ncbi:hypothetical protein ACIBHX_03455 [Nonomuraea sp. NPDC050536]|uniref:hypothetical protein n=1 Tax=Nonomuraea sp. NPDC050536 TaxID=3364366 RepID=UPI0037C87284